MESQVLQAESRSPDGTRTARRLRESGRVPGIIYGHGQAPECFSIDAHAFNLELQHGHRLLTLDLGGQTGSFLIKAVQYDHLGTDPVHIDLMRVDLEETVEIQVAVELVGTAKGATGGAVLDQPLTQLHIECRAGDIPEVIKVRVNDLELNDHLTVADLDLPAGVKVLNPGHEVVAMVKAVAEEAEPGEEEEAATAEPEVISRSKEDQDDSTD